MGSVREIDEGHGALDTSHCRNSPLILLMMVMIAVPQMMVKMVENMLPMTMAGRT